MEGMLPSHPGTVFLLDGAGEMTDNHPMTREGKAPDLPGDAPADVRRELDRLRLEVSSLQASRMRLALAGDAERRSIEAALHDGVQQQLIGLAANLELAAASMNADPATVERLLGEMRHDVQEALEEARNLAHRIYPPLLEAGGLGVALRAAAVTADVPIRIDIGMEGTCPPEIAGVVYRCCIDVLERAGARTPVAVTVWDEEGTLLFEIVADGDMDAELPSRDRVEALAGQMTIRQESDHRTRVAGSLPLSR
jgi:signal transduction histidine kinase